MGKPWVSSLVASLPTGPLRSTPSRERVRGPRRCRGPKTAVEGSLSSVLLQLIRPLERLSDAEVNAPAAIARFAVHEQTGNRVELVAEVEAERTDRRLVAQPRSDRVAKIVELDPERLCPDVAGIEEEHGAEAAAERGAKLLAEQEHAVAADRQSRSAERAHLVASPSANAGGATEKVLFRKRYVDLVETNRMDVAQLHAAGDYEVVVDRQVVPRIRGHRVIVVGTAHDAPGLFGVKRELIAALRVQQVVGGRIVRVEAERVQHTVLFASARIQSERDEIRSQCEVRQRVVRDRAAVVLARHRHGP